MDTWNNPERGATILEYLVKLGVLSLVCFAGVTALGLDVQKPLCVVNEDGLKDPDMQNELVYWNQKTGKCCKGNDIECQGGLDDLGG